MKTMKQIEKDFERLWDLSEDQDGAPVVSLPMGTRFKCKVTFGRQIVMNTIMGTISVIEDKHGSSTYTISYRSELADIIGGEKLNADNLEYLFGFGEDVSQLIKDIREQQKALWNTKITPAEMQLMQRPKTKN